MLATNSVHEVDARVICNSGIFELALDRDDVGRVTERGERLPEKFARLVLEEVAGGGGHVEQGTLEREDVDEIVGLQNEGELSQLVMRGQLAGKEPYLINHEPHELFPDRVARYRQQSVLSNEIDHFARVGRRDLFPHALDRIRFTVDELLLSRRVKGRFFEVFDRARDIGTRE